MIQCRWREIIVTFICNKNLNKVNNKKKNKSKKYLIKHNKLLKMSSMRNRNVANDF